MRESLVPTSDPFVLIEEQSAGYVRYRRSDGLRWEVHGVCDKRGDCVIGAVIDTPDGAVVIRNHQHLEELSNGLGRASRIESEMDVPVTPDFTGCCASPGGPLRIVRL